MVKTGAAYAAIARVLGTKIVNRGRTLRVEGNPVQTFSQTLLLFPVNGFIPPNAERYVDRKTKEEFFAIVISQTKPRNKTRVLVPATKVVASLCHPKTILTPVGKITGISRQTLKKLEVEFDEKWTKVSGERQ